MTAAVILLSLVLSVRDDQRVVVTGLTSLPLPEACGMQVMFRRNCPGCGLTRSFIHLAHGDWQRSLAVHRVGWIIAAAMLFQIPYRLLALRDPSWTLSPYWTTVTVVLLCAMLIVNWLFEMFDMSQ